MTDHPNPSGGSSLGTLLNETLTNVSALVRGEVDLARAEINENINRAAMAVGMIAVALILSLLALQILAAAVVAGLVEAGFTPGLAAAIVGGALALIAVVLLISALRALKATSLAPTRTVRSLQRDAETLKESYNG